MQAAGVRTYIPEKKQARRRHRLQLPKGKRLCYDTGGMGRTHLRKHNNILKRRLIHVAGMNLGLLLRNTYGIGTPRGLQGLPLALHFLVALIAQAESSKSPRYAAVGVTSERLAPPRYHPPLCRHFWYSEIPNKLQPRTARMRQPSHPSGVTRRLAAASNYVPSSRN